MAQILDKVAFLGSKSASEGFLARLSRVLQVTAACLAIGLCAAVSLGVAVVSLFKLALFVSVLALLVVFGAQGRLNSAALMGPSRPAQWFAPALSLAAFSAICLSALWTTADAQAVATGIVKYSKLLIPAILLVCLGSVRSVKRALLVFFAVQLLVMLGTWWVAVFGRASWMGEMPRVNNLTNAPSLLVGYLDQSLMNAMVFGMAWQLRGQFAWRWAKPALVAIAALAVATVFLLPGRSGQVVVVALLGLSVLWALPGKYKLLAGVAPLLLVLAVLAASPATQKRAGLVVTEMQAFQAQGRVDTSTGERLHYWTHALRLIDQHPLLGTGLASWNTEYRRIADPATAPVHASDIRNPHQEYLMWAVQMGVAGVAILLAWFLCFIRDARHFDNASQRATQAAIAATMVAALFNSVLWDALIGDFLCVGIGLAWVLGVRTAEGSA